MELQKKDYIQQEDTYKTAPKSTSKYIYKTEKPRNSS